MTTLDTATAVRSPGRPRATRAPHLAALIATCGLAAVLYAWKLGANGYANAYYAAAVKSMTRSPENFLFGVFDPAGLVTIDKLPMGLWPQVISVEVFGYHGWALVLPQIIEGVLTVAVLYAAVRRWAGDSVALLAAVLMAVTPVAVAVDRDNLPDSLLVLLLVAAAYALTRAVQSLEPATRTAWLTGAAVLVGAGFLTKMMQAWVVAPALGAAYLFAVAAPLRRRLLDLLVAGAALAVVSFSLIVAHDLWPGQVPYAGGSTDGTSRDLVLGYAGFGRLLGGGMGNGMGGGAGPGDAAGAGATNALTGGMSGVISGGTEGLGRMFSAGVGEQVSWFLPVALLTLLGIAVAAFRRRHAGLPADPATTAGWVLWGSWLLVTALVFSVASGIWHPYYTLMLAPAIAATAAAGLVAAWRAYRRSQTRIWWLLPAAVAVTGAWAFVLTSRAPDWHGWLRSLVLVVSAVAVVVLVAARRRLAGGGLAGRLAVGGLALAVIVLAPTVWSVGTAVEGTIFAALPAAGPPDPTRALLARIGVFSDSLSEQQQRILSYAEQHDQGTTITLAVDDPGLLMSAYIVDSDATIIGAGGYSGTDPVPTVDQFQNLVESGALRFVLSDPPSAADARPPSSHDTAQQRRQWIASNCVPVDPTLYGGSTTNTLSPQNPFSPSTTLYRCGQR